MAQITLDIAKFRSSLPEFTSNVTWPDELIQLYFDQAICIMEDEGCACVELQLFLLTGHLLKLHQNAILKNKQGGFVNQSSIDKVSVSKVAPPVKDMFDWWMSQTVYGQQLLAMLAINTVGGFYVGGHPEGDAFRKAYGVF